MNITLLDNEVPETVMKFHNADISIICQYMCYKWVMYNDTSWQLPHPKFVLGQYLVPEIDVGSTMTSKILRKTSEVIPQSTFRPLMLENMDNMDLK